MTEIRAEVSRHDSELASEVAAFCRRGYQPPAAAVRRELREHPMWRAATACGTGLWLDTGDIDAIRSLWTREFSALTTNNTLLNKEVQKGIYDDLVPEAAGLLRAQCPDIAEPQLILEIAFVLNAVHGLRLVSTFDADVSVELHTDLARDADSSYQYGKRFAAIEPDRFIVKIPLTPEGLVAARRLSDDGIRVNFTLGFSARQNHLIARLSRPAWVNVFMGRLNSFVADNGLGDGRNVGEKSTLASQREVRALRESGLAVRQIGASIRSGQQVLDLIGIDVMTIPTRAAREFTEIGDTSKVADRTASDPEVSLSRSVDADRIGVLWNIDDGVRAAADALAARPVDSLSGDAVRSALREHGAADLFSDLDDRERGVMVADGKIPVYSTWQARVEAGEASWDGILTESALGSFATDQHELDARIRQSL